MRIVFLYHSIAIFGGLERVLADKMNYLAELDYYEIFFITSAPKKTPFAYSLSSKIKHIDLNGIPYNTVCIPNPLTYIPKKTTIRNNSKKIICAARLYREKGPDILIQAWSKIAKKYPDWSIHLYGDGYLKDELKQMIKAYQLEESFFIHNPVSNIYEKYEESEFMVLSSRAEGFGLVLAEAMSCGIPCVAFNCPYGPDEIITNNIDGLIAQNGNIEDLATKMDYMINHPKERQEMGQQARKAIEKYRKENVMQQWIDLYESLYTNHKRT